MSEQKDRYHISEDELEHRLQEQERIMGPAKNAVAITREFMCEVVKDLGVDVEKDDLSIKTQMEILDIYAKILPGEEAPKAGGIYISAWKKGELRPVAYIKEPDVDSTGKYVYTPAYWDGTDFKGSRRVKIA